MLYGFLRDREDRLKNKKREGNLSRTAGRRLSSTITTAAGVGDSMVFQGAR